MPLARVPGAYLVLADGVPALYVERGAKGLVTLPALADPELGPTLFRTRWGEFFSVETMLEHAVVHPMRHRIQLERALAGAANTR